MIDLGGHVDVRPKARQEDKHILLRLSPQLYIPILSMFSVFKITFMRKKIGMAFQRRPHNDFIHHVPLLRLFQKEKTTLADYIM